MPKQWTLLIVTTTMLLGVFAAGCTPDAGTKDTDAETTAQVDPTEAAAASVDDEPTQTAAPEAQEPDEPADESGPEPTLGATMEAFYQEFSLPEKGDPEAPVVLYEFSDYT